MHSHHARGVGSLLGADDTGLLEVKVFGRLRLSCNGKVISSFPTPKVEELLAYLLLNTDVDHEREKLADLLWPDIVNDNGRSRLSTTLWRIRVLLRSVNFHLKDFWSQPQNQFHLSPIPISGVMSICSRIAWRRPSSPGEPKIRSHVC